jgi:hypothetical protein
VTAEENWAKAAKHTHRKKERKKESWHYYTRKKIRTSCTGGEHGA